jgi:LmbE family N-acetylglucosaminyl deacetylase
MSSATVPITASDVATEVSGGAASPPALDRFYHWLKSPDRRARFDSRVAVVVAHPDDEMIGAGAHLGRMSDLALVHCTDGSPRNLHDAIRAGCMSREDYASLRQRELEAALAHTGHEPSCARSLRFTDQEASLHLGELVRTVTAALDDLRPGVVLTHPYEGGHPDHDATAFAVHAAAQLLKRDGAPVPAVVEASSYHNRGGTMAVGAFLPAPSAWETEVLLSADEQRLKEILFACFRSQAPTLAAFPRAVERFRAAPAYDFFHAPHPGRLYYELFEWGMTGERWRALAAHALDQFSLLPNRTMESGLAPA